MHTLNFGPGHGRRYKSASPGDEHVEEGADGCRRGGECGSDAVQRSGPRDGRAPILSDSRTADRGAREAGRCPGTLRPVVTEADDGASAALPSPQTLAVLGVGSWTIPGRPSPGSRASRGEPGRSPGRDSLGSDPNDLLPGTNLGPPAAGRPCSCGSPVMGGGKRSVSQSPPSRADDAGGDEPCRPAPAGEACRGGGGRGEHGVEGGSTGGRAAAVGGEGGGERAPKFGARVRAPHAHTPRHGAACARVRA